MLAVEDVSVNDLPSIPFKSKSNLPTSGGIYFVISAEEAIIYIGRTVNFRARWKQHHRIKQIKSEYPNTRIAWLECVDVKLLHSIESALIKAWNPLLNRSPVKPRLREEIEPTPCLPNDSEYLWNALLFRESKVDEFLGTGLVKLAKESGIALETWSRWVNGKRSPSLDTLREIAPKLCDGMSMAELTAGIEELRTQKNAPQRSDFRAEKMRKPQATAA